MAPGGEAMRLPYRLRPGPGFVVLVTAWVLVALFLLWGFATPDLDVVWSIRHGLRFEESVALSDEERAALERSLERHPELRLAITPDGRAVRRRAGEEEIGGRQE